MRNMFTLLVMALANVGHHKMRSLLTMLGIVFGVGAVVSMLAISAGARSEALTQIENMGLHNVIVRSVKPPLVQNKNKGDWVMHYGLTFSDRDHIESLLPSIQDMVMTRTVRKKIWRGARRIDADIFAVEPGYAHTIGLDMNAGRFICDVDMEQRNATCVLGYDVARDFFAYANPIGEDIRIGSEFFRVVGVLRSGQKDGNKSIYIPERTAASVFGIKSIVRESGSFSGTYQEISELIIQFDDRADVLSMSRAVDHLLDKRHDKSDYEMTVPLELLQQRGRTQAIFTIIMASIAGISLLVGGIGIMNIMLATVLERTKEIGIRRALGATRSDIISQFLVETVVLSSLGGLLGLAVGVGGAKLVTHFAEWQTIVSPSAMIISFGISFLVGLVFGVYPALRAARMKPVDALRHTG